MQEGVHYPEWKPVNDHCGEVMELEDEDGDTLSAVCKTDVDHMLGHLYDCCLFLHLVNHQVNQWLHLIGKAAGRWGHPFFHLEYTEPKCPDFFRALPPTLKPGLI